MTQKCATRGYKWSDESRKKASASQKIAVQSPERKKASSANITKYNKTQRGIPKTKSHREKISKSNIGKKVSVETIKKIVETKAKNPVRPWLGKKKVGRSREKMKASTTNEV